MGIRDHFRRLRAAFHRNQLHDELEEEMRLHVELRARKLQEQGLDAREAAYAAKRQFGNQTLIRETTSDMWGWMAWEHLTQDVRHALRALRKTPGFTTVAILTLGLGLGMNTAVFSIVNAVMIQRLPYPASERLVSLWEQKTKDGKVVESRSSKARFSEGLHGGVAPATLKDWQDSRTLSGLAGFEFALMNLTGSGSAQQLWGQSVTANFLSVLGVAPEMGRNFAAEEDRPGSAAVVIISHEFWEHHFNADTEILNRSMVLDGAPYQIIGVLPRGFQSPSQFGLADRIAFYVPAAYPQELLANHGDHEIYVLGRLAPHADERAAQAELDAISADLGRQFPKTNAGLRAVIAPLEDQIIRGIRTPLLAVLAAAGLIVLITCLNVANLLLVP